jgi:hypothetical protein
MTDTTTTVDEILEGGRKSGVYVLRRHVNGRPTESYAPNAAYRILDEHRDCCLDGKAIRALDAYDQETRTATSKMLAWGIKFVEGLDDGLPQLPRRKGRATVPHPASSAGAGFPYTFAELVLIQLWLAGDRGTTTTEIKLACGVVSDAVSGALSNLDQAGVARRLQEKR